MESPTITPLLPGTTRALDLALARAQHDDRLPSLVAGVLRGGALVWTGSRGSAGVEPAQEVGSAAVQYRIGSITKTFVAVAVMRLREEGRLDLGDPVAAHLPELGGAAVGELGVGTLLAQSSGLQAETDGPWWERTPGGDWASLLPTLTSAGARRLPPGTRYHYSNLGYGVLGELVARLRSTPWATVVADELLGPLGMGDTTTRPRRPHARGLAVHPWADVVLDEPEHDAGAMGPAGQLWSTIGDLATWSQVLAGTREDVLSAGASAAMRQLSVVDAATGPTGTPPTSPPTSTPTSTAGWTSGYGLGLQLWHEGGTVWFGHSGSMPGFVAMLRLGDDGDGAIAMTNSTRGFGALATNLLAALRTAEPPMPPLWVPAPVADAARALLGPWYWGPTPLVITAAGSDGGPGDIVLTGLGGRARASRFTAREDGTWVGRDGYYAGEVLRAVRPVDGQQGALRLDLASFALTRTPYERGADVPGGVDPAGWRS